jgi:hypothetical protein
MLASIFLLALAPVSTADLRAAVGQLLRRLDGRDFQPVSC